MPRQMLHKWTGAALVALAESAAVYRVSADQIRSDSRHREIVRARHYAWAILRAQGNSYPLIGELCGGYDHSTVLAALTRLPDGVTDRATKFALSISDRGKVEALHRARLAIWSNKQTPEDRIVVAEHFQDLRYVQVAQRGGVQ